MTVNPPKRAATASFIFAAFFAIMFFVPEVVGLDGFDGGFAISLISLVVALTSLVVGFIFRGQGVKLDRILRGQGILAHWVYQPALWGEFTKEEHIQDKSEKKGLFLIITAFSLLIGVLFWFFDNEAGFYVLVVMFGLMGLCFAAWQLSAWSNYHQNLRNSAKEVYITAEALYLNGKFVSWRGWFTHFNDVTLEERQGLLLLIFKYTVYSGRAGPQIYTTRVPVPRDQELNAAFVVEQVKLQN